MDLGKEIKVWEIPTPVREPLELPTEAPEPVREPEKVPA